MTVSIFQPVLAFLGSLGWPEMLILGLLGVIIFGKRLPQVGKSLGQGIVEFKKGLSGVESEIDDAVQASKKLEDPSSTSGGTLNTSESKTTTPPHSA
ncbi:MAG: twin-arginine translocase TatA/TatE family subunit [Planctomycetota bacterium]